MHDAMRFKDLLLQTTRLAAFQLKRMTGMHVSKVLLPKVRNALYQQKVQRILTESLDIGTSDTMSFSPPITRLSQVNLKSWTCTIPWRFGNTVLKSLINS
mmetsp:Transcript_43259/g.115723  ORF Transcript_43259/g.115723 Transcript_43259/m.115723 type:complete len:100 (-) Transcript_43259:84-383(-)